MGKAHVLDQGIPYEKYFEEICQIPHGSSNERQLSDHLVDFAKGLGLRYHQYENGALIIYKNASAGYEDHEPVMLQGHMDMVCQKVPGSAHNFEKDPLDLYVEDGLIRARGTTLGADDGVGVAYMMAILSDDTLKHPPLECVFTTEEELGCIGVEALRAEDLASYRMIGLDDISGDSTTICAAGAVIEEYRFLREQEGNAAQVYQMQVDGLNGGHSGDKIHMELANAVKIASRVMYELLLQGADIRLSSFDGGSAANSIPRACSVVFASSLSEKEIQEKTAGLIAAIQEEYRWSDAGLTVTFQKSEIPAQVYSAKDSRAVLEYLYLMPDGYMHHSLHLKGLTTASSNIGILQTRQGEMRITYMSRGASDSFTDETVNRIRLLSEIYGWSRVSTNRSACWEYQEGSKLREVLGRVFKEVTGREIIQVAEHGGLECGAISRMRPEMDIVTLGPKVRGYHTYEEYLDRASFTEIWRVLTAVLEQL